MILIRKFNSNWSVLLASGIVFTMFLISCQPAQEQAADAAESQPMEANPAADGFDMNNSDAEAIEVADKVMEAMGGRSAWDHTRYISWNFFGNRHLVWDKYDGDVRIEFPDSTVYLVNIYDGSGSALKNGQEVVHADSLAQELDRAKRIWINDSYWLVMPYKLKDSGVTLKHMGIEEDQQGTPAHVLQLTFQEVGVTPQNRYLVYVDTATNLVCQWAFYRDANQDSANFILPWTNYQQYGEIMLADNRGERNLDDVMVYDSLPEEVFTSLAPVELSNY